MAYFDNAATTYPKPECVYESMDTFYRECGGSAGRGNHSLSKSVGEVIAETRNNIKELLHCPAKQVVFTPTATIALNMIIQGIVKDGAKRIYISPFEHNAVTRTLHGLEKEYGIKIEKLTVTEDLKYDLDQIRYQFDSIKPDIVIISHASNTIGLIAPVEKICSLAKKYEALTVIDMAQTAGLVDLNVGLDIFDFAVFAGHKTLYGPTGISGFIMKPEVTLPSVLYGGTGFESANQDMPESIPERYEMGTLNTVGIAGLNASVKWILETGIDNLFEKEKNNREKLLKILEQYDFIHAVGLSPELEYVGIVSCRIDGISSDSAGGIFNEQGVAVRTGLHCAPVAHQFLNTFPAGTVRFSVNYFTGDEDFEQLRCALDYIEENL